MKNLNCFIQESLVKKNTTTIQYDEYVDLGLPSGVKWASWNLGADEPEETGLYFAWGETEGFTADDVKSGKRLFDKESYQYKDNPKTLPLKDDAAHVMLGVKWRMPEREEIQELKDNCKHTTETLNGVKGCRLTSKINGNSIFIPFTGNCNGSYINDVDACTRLWSSSIYSSNNNGAYDSFCYFDGFNIDYYERCYGFTIRPVYK